MTAVPMLVKLTNHHHDPVYVSSSGEQVEVAKFINLENKNVLRFHYCYMILWDGDSGCAEMLFTVGSLDKPINAKTIIESLKRPTYFLVLINKRSIVYEHTPLSNVDLTIRGGEFTIFQKSHDQAVTISMFNLLDMQEVA